jgi:hypothetical protein
MLAGRRSEFFAGLVGCDGSRRVALGGPVIFGTDHGVSGGQAASGPARA